MTVALPSQEHSDILLIHLGGLGDVCLSESTFLSLVGAFDRRPVALGNPRFLRLFDRYFSRIEDGGSRRWAHLFGGIAAANGLTPWRRIVFIGKDRSGRLRGDLQHLSREPLLFVEMYPDGAQSPEGLHVESFQLRQLGACGIEPTLKEISPTPARRAVLYPEKGFRKRKWPVEGFLALSETFAAEGVETELVVPFDGSVPLPRCRVIDDLGDLVSFLRPGGVFVSNDCGVAHLAGALGLRTVTIFHDHEPAIWHPRGRNISLDHGREPVTPEGIAGIVLSLLD